MQNVQSKKRRPVPAFAADVGLTAGDLVALGGEVEVLPFAIRSIQRDATGEVTGIETMQDLRRFAFTPGGTHGLFAAPRDQHRARLLLATGPFEAICAAVVEGHRADTTYAAPPGRWVPRAAEALVALIERTRVTQVVLGFSVGTQGDQLAARASGILLPAYQGVLTLEALPPRAGSWAQELRARRCVRAA